MSEEDKEKLKDIEETVDREQEEGLWCMKF